jgi:transcriptional regulator with XRE-family HTH domain
MSAPKKRRQRMPNVYGPGFAKILVPLRESKRLSQEDLAKLSLIPLRTIRMYERGTRDVGLVDLILIAFVLEVDPVKLVRDLMRKGRQ